MLDSDKKYDAQADFRGAEATEMAPMNVSIAMTTYNRAAHLQEQLDSLAAQQLLPAELVVGDDGSTDDTLNILERFARIAPFPVRIHRNPQRLGYRANFMNVVRLCTSPLISFCDQDDVWLPQNLSQVARCFADPDVLLTFHNARVVDAQRKTISRFYAEPLPPISRRLTFSPWMFSYGFTQTFRADLLPAVDYWNLMKDHHHADEAMGHDLFFFLLASGLGSICYIDEELTEYRLHAGNTIGSGKRTKPSFLDRWRYRLEDRSGTYRYLAYIAPIDAGLFTHLSTVEALPSHLRQRSAEAAAAWNGLGLLYHDRAKVCSAGLLGRIAAFIRLYRKGAYGETSFWTFGAKAMTKDFVLGVMLAPLVKRYGRPSSRSDRACRRGRNYTIPTNTSAS
jgi:glycosyltransferase involved in cell wall biosynthesis